MPPDADHSPLAQNDERARLEMERNWQMRQQNVLPLETARNEGRFYGLALKGSARLTGVHRMGLFMLGILALGSALAMSLADDSSRRFGPTLKSIHHALPDVDLFLLPIIVLEVALGLRLWWVALKPPARSHQPHR